MKTFASLLDNGFAHWTRSVGFAVEMLREFSPQYEGDEAGLSIMGNRFAAIWQLRTVRRITGPHFQT